MTENIKDKDLSIKDNYSIDRYNFQSGYNNNRRSSQNGISPTNIISSSKIYKYLIFDFGLLTKDFTSQTQIKDNAILEKGSYIHKISFWSNTSEKLSSDILLPFRVKEDSKTGGTQIHYILDSDSLNDLKDINVFIEFANRNTAVPLMSGSCCIKIKNHDSDLFLSKIKQYPVSFVVNSNIIKDFSIQHESIVTSSFYVSSHVTTYKIRQNDIFSVNSDFKHLRHFSNNIVYDQPSVILKYVLMKTDLSRSLYCFEEELDINSNNYFFTDYCFYDYHFSDVNNIFIKKKEILFLTIDDFQLPKENHGILNHTVLSSLCIIYQVSARIICSNVNDENLNVKFKAPGTYLGHITNNEGHWVDSAEIYPPGKVNMDTFHSECQHDAHQILVTISVFSLSKDEKSIMQEILCQGVIKLEGLKSGLRTIDLFTQFNMENNKMKLTTLSVGKISIICERKNNETEISKCFIQNNIGATVDSKVDLFIDSISNIKPFEIIKYIENSYPNVCDVLYILIYCSFKVVYIDQYRIQVNRSNQNLFDGYELLLKKIMKLLSSILQVMSRRFLSEEIGNRILLWIGSNINYKNALTKALNVFYEDWLTSKVVTSLIAQNPNSEESSVTSSGASTTNINDLVGEKWSLLRSGFYCLKLLGDIYRTTIKMNHINTFSDITCQNDSAVYLKESYRNESIQYNHVYEVSHELLNYYLTKSTELISCSIQFIYDEKSTVNDITDLIDLHDNIFLSLNILLENVTTTCQFDGYDPSSFNDVINQINQTIQLFVRSSVLFLQIAIKVFIKGKITIESKNFKKILLKLVKANLLITNNFISSQSNINDSAINNTKNICQIINYSVKDDCFLLKDEPTTLAIVDLLCSITCILERGYNSHLQNYPIIEIDKEVFSDENVIANINFDNIEFINRIISRFHFYPEYDQIKNKLVRPPFSPTSFHVSSFSPLNSPESSMRNTGILFGGESSLRYILKNQQYLESVFVIATTIFNVGMFMYPLNLFGNIIKQTSISLYKGKFNDPIFVQKVIHAVVNAARDSCEGYLVFLSYLVLYDNIYYDYLAREISLMGEVLDLNLTELLIGYKTFSVVFISNLIASNNLVLSANLKFNMLNSIFRVITLITKLLKMDTNLYKTSVFDNLEYYISFLCDTICMRMEDCLYRKFIPKTNDTLDCMKVNILELFRLIKILSSFPTDRIKTSTSMINDNIINSEEVIESCTEDLVRSIIFLISVYTLFYKNNSKYNSSESFQRLDIYFVELISSYSYDLILNNRVDSSSSKIAQYIKPILNSTDMKTINDKFNVNIINLFHENLSANINIGQNTALIDVYHLYNINIQSYFILISNNEDYEKDFENSLTRHPSLRDNFNHYIFKAGLSNLIISKLEYILSDISNKNNSKNFGECINHLELLVQMLTKKRFEDVLHIGDSIYESHYLLKLILLSLRRNFGSFPRNSTDSELEIKCLRDNFRNLLYCGQWELGFHVANIFMIRFKDGNEAGPTFNQIINFRDESLLQSNPINSPVRIKTMQKELFSTMDKFKDKLLSDSTIRLPPKYYAIRFISTNSCPFGGNEDNADLKSIIDKLYFNMGTVSISSIVSKTVDRLYDHWFILKVDVTANVLNSEYYNNNSHSFSDSLISPNGFHTFLWKISEAFSEYTIVPSNELIESYIVSGYNNKFIQLFHALPAHFCNIYEDEQNQAYENSQSVKDDNITDNNISKSEDGNSLHDDNLDEFNNDDRSKIFLEEGLKENKYNLSTFNVYSYNNNPENHFSTVISKYTLNINSYSIPINAMNGNKQYNSNEFDEQIPLNSLLDVTSLSPFNIAVLSEKSDIPIVHAALEVLTHHKTLIDSLSAAIVKLNSFSFAEIINEPKNEITSSDSIFYGAFDLLSQILIIPNVCCIGINNCESIVIAAKEKIELDWQKIRKEKKKEFNREMANYDSNNEKQIKPVEMDYKQLKEDFDESCGLYEVLELEQVLQQCITESKSVMKEMRSFVQKYYDAHQTTIQTKSPNITKDDIRDLAMKKGRRPTEASLTLGLSIKESLETVSEVDYLQNNLDDMYTFKLKFCLYLESLIAAVEIGLPL